MRCIDEEIPFELPNSWAWVRISSIANIVMGSSPKSENISKNRNLVEFHQGKIFFTQMYIEKSNQYTSEVTKISPADSVLLCVRAPVGEINITKREICIGRGLSSIHHYSTIHTKFLFYWLKTCKQELMQKSTGSTFSAITADTVNGILLPLPPIEEQYRIEAIIEELFEKLSNVEASLM